MFSKSVFVFATVLLSLCASVQSFSGGAAGCAFDPPIGGKHVDTSNGKVIKEYNWTDTTKPLQLSVDGKKYAPGSVISVPIGKSVLVAITGIKIKGVLMRFEGPFGYNLTDTVLPKTGTKLATACLYPKVGITHPSPDDKPLVSGTLKLKELADENLVLTTTIVYFNSDSLSEYSYTKFEIKPCKLKSCSAIAKLFGCKPKC